MTSIYNIAGGVSPDKSGKVYLPTDAEFAFFGLGDPYADTKKALWIDPVMAIGGLSDGPPGLFTLQDRFGDRLFVPEPLTSRHPIILADSVTGKLAMHFGAGGAGPNVLTPTINGALVTSPGLDAYGVGKSSALLYAPNQGWACAAKFRVGASFNGFNFTTPGGALLANAGVALAPTGFMVSIETSAGNLRAFNQYGTTTDGQYLNLSGHDLRDNAWHTALLQYDFAAGSLTCWLDPVAGTDAPTKAITGVTTDITTATGNALPEIGAVNSGATTSVNAAFNGAISHLSWFPAPIWSVAANRQIAINLLAER